MVKNLAVKTQYLKRAKRFLLPTLLISLFLNIILLLSVIPIASVSVGCPQYEKHLSVLSAGSDRLNQAKISAERLNKEMTSQKDELPLGVAEGASQCSGVTYKLYVF